MSRPIEDYALIGDLETAALVGRDGSIDWLCWPRFDSDSTFAALIGGPENGHWHLRPREKYSVARRYRGHTLILDTEFRTDAGRVRITDFMPLRGKNSDVVRIVEGLDGTVDMDMGLHIRFGYGRHVPWVRRLDRDDETVLAAVAGPDMVVLRTPVKTHGENLQTRAEFTVNAGDAVPFVLSYGPSYDPLPDAFDPAGALHQAEEFWTRWSARSVDKLKSLERLGPRARDLAIRSLITLKALTHQPTGGIVAAATTSLPERIGGERNWDYRYCWLRDATLSLLALMDAGYYDEASAWRDWLLRAVAGSPDQLQIMYGVGGERRLIEWTADWLEGYEKSRPVRIGNAAHDQLQLDVFGEVADALFQALRGGIAESDAAWALQVALLDRLEQVWTRPDSGMWEMRGEPQHFTYSKIMAWVAVDRCIRRVESLDHRGPVDAWRQLRERIHNDVCSRGFSHGLNAFVQTYGGDTLDASLLLIPTLGFLPASDRRYRTTVEAIEKRLVVDGLVSRYDTRATDDGVGGREGAFIACSFWLVDAYVMLDRRDDARRLFDRLLDLTNDVGLLAEEFDPQARRALGNFPQAFSHVALVHSAVRLARPPSAEHEERKPTDDSPAN